MASRFRSPKRLGESQLLGVARNEEPAAKKIKKTSIQHLIYLVACIRSYLLDIGKFQLVILQIWGEEVKAESTMGIDCRSWVLEIDPRC